jgi:alkaline phosphatase D
MASDFGGRAMDRTRQRTGTSRREFLRLGGLSTVALMLGTGHLQSGRAWAAPRLNGNPFALGVASGDPRPGGVVLWTRLAPEPLAGGGMPDTPVDVRWEVATNERFRRPVARGRATALPGLGHSVHPEVRGLEPDREYFYRFIAAGEESPIGRTRTAPAPTASPDRLRFAFASCQNYQDGYFTAHSHLAEEDIAFVAFLGDYIYEGAGNPNALRPHEGTGEPITIEGYRNRYGQYQSDPNLQAAQAHCPWIVTFDDHEVDNNWADDIPQDPQLQSPEAFRDRRSAAFQAYYEHMPLRIGSRPAGPDMQLYRRLAFGDLVQLDILDTRQYRSDQPPSKDAAYDPTATMTGTEQERWLLQGLLRSRARWSVIGQQTMIAQNDRRAGPEEVYDFDNWDGYRVQRRRLLEVFGSDLVNNPVVLTGDRHATWVCDLKPDFDDPHSRVVGAELTGTSMSSGGDGNPTGFRTTYDPIRAESPHWKYADGRRGYMVCDVTREGMDVELRHPRTVRAPESGGISTIARFHLADGRPGVDAQDVVPPA